MPVPLPVRYLVRFLLLIVGVAFASYGLIAWHDQGFELAGVWLYDNDWRVHPLHFLVFGVVMIPPAMWEIFVLELLREARQRTGAEDSGG